MARRITAAISSVLRPEKDPVHFHSGPSGPYVCEVFNCTSPSLDPQDF